MGAQSWFPSNSYPTDKATFDTRITVPSSKTALGVGELASRTRHRDGTTTWRWTEDDPTATYLTTATVGDFDYVTGTMTETSTGRTCGSTTPSTAAPRRAEGGDPGVAGPGTRSGQLPEQPVRALPLRLHRRRRRPCCRGGLRARGADQAALRRRVHQRQPVDQHRDAAARAGSPVGRQQRHPGELERHLVQRGLGNWSEWWWQFRENGGETRRPVRRPLRTTRPRTGRSRLRSWTATRPTVRVLPDL